MKNIALTVLAALAVLLLALPSAAAAHEDEKKVGMKMDKEMAAGYIRVATPAGMQAVIGRKNPVPTLEPEIVPDDRGHAVKVFRLTVEDVEFEVAPGKKVKWWGFNGSVPGPTIRVNEGDRIRSNDHIYPGGMLTFIRYVN